MLNDGALDAILISISESETDRTVIMDIKFCDPYLGKGVAASVSGTLKVNRHCRQ